MTRFKDKWKIREQTEYSSHLVNFPFLCLTYNASFVSGGYFNKSQAKCSLTKKKKKNLLKLIVTG